MSFKRLRNFCQLVQKLLQFHSCYTFSAFDAVLMKNLSSLIKNFPSFSYTHTHTYILIHVIDVKAFHVSQLIWQIGLKSLLLVIYVWIVNIWIDNFYLHEQTNNYYHHILCILIWISDSVSPLSWLWIWWETMKLQPICEFDYCFQLQPNPNHHDLNFKTILLTLGLWWIENTSYFLFYIEA